MVSWAFYDYLEPSGNCPFSDWLLGLPDDAQACIDQRLLTMEGMGQWPEKWASRYTAVTGLVEIRIRFKKVQYRPLGIYQPDHRFVLLGGGIEKGNRIPKGTLEAIGVRRKLLEQGRAHVRRHTF